MEAPTFQSQEGNYNHKATELVMSLLHYQRPHSTHHATVEVLVHLAEGVWRRLALAGDDDADVGDGQGVLGLDGWRTA